MTNGRTIHHQYWTMYIADRSFCCSPDKDITQDLAAVRSQHQQVGRYLCCCVDDPGEGIVQNYVGFAAYSFHNAQASSKFREQQAGILDFVIDDTPRPVIIDDVQERKVRLKRFRQNYRAAKRTIGARREIGADQKMHQSP